MQAQPGTRQADPFAATQRENRQSARHTTHYRRGRDHLLFNVFWYRDADGSRRSWCVCRTDNGHCTRHVLEEFALRLGRDCQAYGDDFCADLGHLDIRPIPRLCRTAAGVCGMDRDTAVSADNYHDRYPAGLCCAWHVHGCDRHAVTDLTSGVSGGHCSGLRPDLVWDNRRQNVRSVPDHAAGWAQLLCGGRS